MVTFLKYTLAATLAVGAAHASHNRQLRHVKRHAHNQVEKRGDSVQDADVPTATVYELDGQILSPDEAKKGLAGGEFIVIGETTPTPVAAKPSKDLKAQFIESKASSTSTSTSTSTTETTTTSPPTSTSTSTAESTSDFTSESTSMFSTSAPPTTTSSTSTTTSALPTSTEPARSSTSAPAAEPSEISGGGAGSDFPSGKIKCSEFPSQWGAVALDWLGFGGWSGLQFVPEYVAGASSISDIITGVVGQSCEPGAMCSYACPVGLQKTQWPDAQGSTKQSIGGLYCNSEGYLELTRPSSKSLCEAGEGGVSIQNDLDELVSTCRTDYPGTESMVIPAVAEPGASIPLCNPDQSTYYQWQGLGTSGQYYVNKKGVTPDKGCLWNSPEDHDSRGNWAPVICGVGKAADGITYISIFQNLPTSNAKLDFNIEITGDVNSKCSYIDGEWTGGDSGCTTGMQPGGKAVIRYF